MSLLHLIIEEQFEDEKNVFEGQEADDETVTKNQ